MPTFQAFDTNVEVLGRNIVAIFNAMINWPMMSQATQTVIKAYNVPNLQPDQWYPHQLLLDILRDIGIKLGTGTLHKIGKQISLDALFPDGIDSIESALHSINIAYHMNHRGGAIGTYDMQQSQARKVQMVCQNPYPCDFDHGIIDALSRRFAPPNSIVSVSHSLLHPCRKAGHDRCTYLISWRPRTGARLK